MSRSQFKGSSFGGTRCEWSFRVFNICSKKQAISAMNHNIFGNSIRNFWSISRGNPLFPVEKLNQTLERVFGKRIKHSSYCLPCYLLYNGDPYRLFLANGNHPSPPLPVFSPPSKKCKTLHRDVLPFEWHRPWELFYKFVYEGLGVTLRKCQRSLAHERGSRLIELLIRLHWTPSIKEQILLSCPHTFLIKVLGRSY